MLAALHLPNFLLQRRFREQPSLRDRPVGIVRPGASETLIALSERALAEGVPLRISPVQGQALCADLLVLPEEPERDLQALEALAEALLSLTPAVERFGSTPLYLDGLFVDASSAPLFSRPLEKLLVECCQDLGYRATIALAENKFTAQARVLHGARTPLDELPLEALPASESLLWAFSRMGLTTLGQLARLPAGPLAGRFGAEGALMRKLARGEDPRPLVPFHPTPPLVETIALEESCETLEPVLFTLKSTVDRLLARLSGRGLALARGRVTLRLDAEGSTAEEVVELPLSRPTTSAKLLVDLFRERLRDLHVPAPVIGVTTEALETGPSERFQLRLGERPEVDAALETVLTRLKASLGEEALFAARATGSYRPETAYEAIPFAPVTSPSPMLGTSAPRPTRLLPTPLAIAHHPKGLPERLEGEWWQPTPFGRDYYRATLPGHGDCWLFRDRATGQTFLHGYFD